jgi:Pentapeptide repeats (8 copies)
MISSNSTRTSPSESPADHAFDAHRFVPVWNGILHEFRNHLTVLVAATSELGAEIPPALALRVGDAVCETERNVQGLTSLLALVDASVQTFEPLICSLGEVVDRAVRLAAPAAGRRLSITTHVPRAVGVRNRGTVLECLMATLIVDLARADLARADLARANLARADLARASAAAEGVEPARSPRVRVDAELGRRGLAIEIASDGARPDAGSWRFLLAMDLAAKLDATLLSQPEVAAYVIQFR